MNKDKSIISYVLFILGAAGTMYGLFRVIQAVQWIVQSTQGDKSELYLHLTLCIFIFGFSVSLCCIAVLVLYHIQLRREIHNFEMRLKIQSAMLKSYRKDRRKRLYQYEEAEIVADPKEFEDIFTNGIK